MICIVSVLYRENELYSPFGHFNEESILGRYTQSWERWTTHNKREQTEWPVCVSQPTEFEEKAVKKVDDLLENYMGIRDTELGGR